MLPILESLGCNVKLVRVVDGEPVPADASAFSGLVFMGGYMSVHDRLPWIARELDLIRDADVRGIWVAGHCLGSQLVALALGGQVHRHERPEMGWCEISAEASDTARHSWGEHAGQKLQTFQWHGDTFEPPPGATRIARTARIAPTRPWYCKIATTVRQLTVS